MTRLLILILSLALLFCTAHGNVHFWMRLFGLEQLPAPVAPVLQAAACTGYPVPC